MPPDGFSVTLAIAGAVVILAGAIAYAGILIMSALDNLTAAVARNTTVEQSAVTMISGLAQQLKDAAAANDTAAVQKLADDLISSGDELAAAIAANTAKPAG